MNDNTKKNMDIFSYQGIRVIFEEVNYKWNLLILLLFINLKQI
jgi:hypothetical protein